MPIVGPKDGSLIAMTVFLCNLFNASPNPTVTVDLPSPAGVGLIAVTRISLPDLFFFNLFKVDAVIFALYFPYNSRSSSDKPSLSAICIIGFITAC